MTRAKAEKLLRENSLRGRAFRMMMLDANPGSKKWFERLKKAVENRQVVPDKIVYCSDRPTEIDITLCVVTKEALIKWNRESGFKDYGRWMADVMGESTKSH